MLNLKYKNMSHKRSHWGDSERPSDIQARQQLSLERKGLGSELSRHITSYLVDPFAGKGRMVDIAKAEHDKKFDTYTPLHLTLAKRYREEMDQLRAIPIEDRDDDFYRRSAAAIFRYADEGSKLRSEFW
jgi:hypothetical protein